MPRVSDQLKEYNLAIRESNNPERQLVDFSIEDDEDNVAFVWGDKTTDVDFECNHPYQCIDFGDGEEQGECSLCGSYCDYHYEEDDEGRKVPEPHEWYPRRNVGGLIGEYLRELEGKNA